MRSFAEVFAGPASAFVLAAAISAGCRRVEPAIEYAAAPLPNDGRDVPSGIHLIGQFAHGARVEREIMCNDVWRLNVVAVGGELLLRRYLDERGGLLNGTYYTIIPDVFRRREGEWKAPADWIPRGDRGQVYWSRRRPTSEDGVETRRIFEVQFRDGLCETERAFGWHGVVPVEQCWRIIQYGPRGTPQKITFPGEQGRSEIVIGESGFVVRRDVVAADATFKSVEYPTPFTSIELRDDGEKGRTYGVTLGRNAFMQYPAYFDLDLTLGRNGGVADISGTMYECEWGEYGYVETYGPDDMNKLFASIQKRSGLSRQDFLEALSRRLEAASSPGPR